MALQKFTVTTETLVKGAAVEANCNEIIFINKSGVGTTIFVDGMPLDNNEFLVDGGNVNEFNVSRYQISSSATALRVIIRRKIYK